MATTKECGDSVSKDAKRHTKNCAPQCVCHVKGAMFTCSAQGVYIFDSFLKNTTYRVYH
eukprot:m.261601 g.261601  ORF g.261601 m.261601 type:complete len:59 (+) comp19697_c0_seq7:2240-2416(+)